MRTVYDEPEFHPAGDAFLYVEFGREMSLKLNFMAQGLTAAILESGLDGILDVAPCYASLLVQYDCDAISYGDLTRELTGLVEALGPSGELVLDSRLVYIPVYYLDPWTRECIDDYRANIADREYDPDYIARINGLADAAAMVRMHAGSEWWIAAIGSWPGLPFAMALDPRCHLTAPKYNPPRTWTPQGTIGLGGSSTAVYSVESPGGYEIIGRTPVPIFDPEPRLASFSDGEVLLRAGDRMKFEPIGAEEYEHVAARVAEGSYVHNIVSYQKFSVNDYDRWVASLNATQGG